ncbi:hypothetical protein AGIG_G13857 [Arapaima gigas]
MRSGPLDNNSQGATASSFCARVYDPGLLPRSCSPLAVGERERPSVGSPASPVESRSSSSARSAVLCRSSRTQKEPRCKQLTVILVKLSSCFLGPCGLYDKSGGAAAAGRN